MQFLWTIRKVFSDIFTCLGITLHPVEIKRCALNLDTAYIMFPLQRILIKPENPERKITKRINMAIQVENLKLFSVEVKRDAALTT